MHRAVATDRRAAPRPARGAPRKLRILTHRYPGTALRPAHDETGLIVESTRAAHRREDAFEALHEALVSKPKLFEVPAQTGQPLRSVVVSEIGVEDDDLGERIR